MTTDDDARENGYVVFADGEAMLRQVARDLGEDPDEYVARGERLLEERGGQGGE
jgi:hypothetical protein